MHASWHSFLYPECTSVHPAMLLSQMRAKISSEPLTIHVQILYTVAALGVADVLGEIGPQTAHQLAETLGMPLSCFHM